MVFKYNLSRGAWEKNDFRYVYSPVAISRKTFIEEDNCLVNSFNEESLKYDYVSLAHKNRFTVGDRATLECSFDNFGAPLITLANCIYDDGKNLMYSDHYEVVAYEDGCNVWYVRRAPDGSELPFISENCLSLYFPIKAGDKISMSVSLRQE